MLPDAGTSKGCQDELNAQLQAIDARLKQAEKNISVLAKGISEVAAGVPTPSFGAIGNYFKAMAAMAGDAFAKEYQKVVDAVPDDISEFMTGLLLQAALMQLGAATIAVSEMANATQQLEDLYNSTLDEIRVWQDVIPPTEESINEINRLTNLLSTIQSASDSAISMMNAVSNISQCKSKSLLIS